MENNFKIPITCYKSYNRYQHEILLEVNQAIIDSTDKVVTKNALNLKLPFLYQDLKFHQEMIKNFFYFNEVGLLKKYILWRYRVYFYRQIDLEYIVCEYEIWKTISKKFVDPICFVSINKIYDWLINNHRQFIKKSLEEEFLLEDTKDITLYQYAISGDFDSFFNLSKEHCETLFSFCDFFSNHISNITKYVGYQWEINNLSVAKEHLSSSIIEKTAFGILESFPIQNQQNQTIIIAAAKDEYHFLGGKIAIAILEKMGFKVINLGANTPKKEIISIYNEFHCDYLILVASLSTSLENMSETIKEIKKYDTDENTKIIISGNAFDSLLDPTKTLGVEQYFKNYIQMYQFFLS